MPDTRRATRRRALRRACGTRGVVLGVMAWLCAGGAATASAAPAVPPSAVISTVSGALTPGDLHQAYALPNLAPRRQTIALVVPYHHPDLASDLANYLSQFRLSACSVKQGCLRILNENGQAAPLPKPDPTGGSWNVEASLSAEVIRGVCQNCSLLVFEAGSASKYDLSLAVRAAMRSGSSVISTTFVLPEEATDTQYQPAYSGPRAVVVSAVGDTGYAPTGSFPSSLPNVVAVGGTQLRLDSRGRYRSETAWSSTTSACSLYSSAPAWQSALANHAGCGTHRAIADVSAVADPGAAVHVTNAGQPNGPWYEIGGTSLAAPIIAGVLGLAGGGGPGTARALYDRARLDPAVLHDVRSGTNSPVCGGLPICQAQRGFDGPTGLGTPDGLAAFTPMLEELDPQHPQVRASAPRGLIRTSQRWSTAVTVTNHNHFGVRVSLTLTSARRVRVGGRTSTIAFASGGLDIGPGGTRSATLRVPRRYQPVLARLRNLPVVLVLRLSAPIGPSVTVRESFRLLAP